ncbi:urea ABC transporter permease subunit UrtB [Salinisphaera sp. T31B1]|uniref:urea ABC transporter permease subunit UrtB n=1 Tax=Salinisphaera sp. T31B1 TaxID=727963 RepID=UPI0033407E44
MDRTRTTGTARRLIAIILALGLAFATAAATAQDDPSGDDPSSAVTAPAADSAATPSTPSASAETGDGSTASADATTATPDDAPSEDNGFDYDGTVAALATANYPEKRRIVTALAAHPRAHTAELLAAFADNRLVVRKADDKVFVAEDNGDDYALRDPITFEPAGSASTRDFEPVRTNIGLRQNIGVAQAQLELDADDADTRLAAVETMSEKLDDNAADAMRAHRASETDDDVLKAIDRALAINDLNTGDNAAKLEAIERLSGDNSQMVYNRLKNMLILIPEDTADADQARLRAAAAAQVERVDWWRTVYDYLETLFFGLSLGSILVLAGIGLAITFGVMGVINMAHGELIMLGAYTAFVMQQLLPGHIGVALVLAVPAAFLVSGLVGILIERSIVQWLYGRPLETLLATFGVSLFLQQLVRSVFTPLNRSVASPEWMSGLIRFNDLFALTANRLVILAFSMAVFAALILVMHKTSLGLKVRAVSQNRDMARAMGIRTQRLDALTFGLGSGVAGIAGVALSQLTNVGPNLGQSYIIDSFMVVVFGGVGNLWGTLVSGLSLGVLTKFIEPQAGAVLAKIIVLIFLILFIQRRPRGLFPQKGRTAEGS